MTTQIQTGPPAKTRHDPYLALRSRNFRLLLAGRLITAFGNEMLTFAIGWELWLRTRSAFALGMVGLAQVLPVLLLSLPGGSMADRHNRRQIVRMTQAAFASFALGLGLLSYFQGPLWLIYACLLGIGIARAFNDPAASTLVPEAVPPELYTSAVTWSSSAWQVAAISGPAAAGLVVGFLNNVTWIYAFDALAALSFLVLLGFVKGRPLALSQKAATLDSLLEGFRFVRGTKVILAAITLDMFAVLFGGAVALLPIYATDILQVGPQGLGLMRAAPSVGPLLMAFSIAHLPPFQRAGRTLLVAVAGFGVATIVFGLSKNFALSLMMLVLLGALDNISVIIRHTLLLTFTPDEMRGRTAAVNSIFIGTSNELGAFESGTAAALLGPVLAVVAGGIGTLLVVLAAAKVWPEMRELKTLDAPGESSR